MTLPAELCQAPAPAAPGTTYLVGGAVRDHLLGLTVGERDWVVTGSTPEQMAAAGFKPVGRDFPVFLHPLNGEEYALARQERKSGHGYGGFVFHADPSVTLEDDLARRDLRINAIAANRQGELIDPYHGHADIRERRLRHVAPAFAEDPLRVLRVARFAARFAALGFSIAAETLALMRQLAISGELGHLTPERVWRETAKALCTDRPDVYLSALRDCAALKELFPEIDALFGVPQPAKYHPEIDSGVHTLLALRQAARHDVDEAVRFAVMVHDLGKGTTPAQILPSHRGHEARGVPLVRALCERLRVPRAHSALAECVTAQHLRCHQALQLRPETVLRLIEAADGLRRPERFAGFLQACQCDAQGRTGLEEQPYPQAEYLRRCRDAAATIDIGALTARGLSGPAMGEAVRKARIAAIRSTSKPPG